jgi:hypothetical protein
MQNPIVYLHSEEDFLPSSVNYIYDNSDLCSEDKTIRKAGDFTIDTASQLSQGYPKPFLKIPPSAWEGQLDLSQVPMYHYTRKEGEDKTAHIYIFIYPYNGPYNILGFKAGEHQGDVEHVTVIFNDVTKKIEKVYFSAHGSKDGLWVENSDLEFDDGRLVIYSAKHSHACYPKSGMYPRIGCLANDYTEKGMKWHGTVIDIDGDTVWNSNYIALGEIYPPKFKGWWVEEDTYSTGYFRRIFCCC